MGLLKWIFPILDNERDEEELEDEISMLEEEEDY